MQEGMSQSVPSFQPLPLFHSRFFQFFRFLCFPPSWCKARLVASSTANGHNTGRYQNKERNLSAMDNFPPHPPLFLKYFLILHASCMMWRSTLAYIYSRHVSGVLYHIFGGWVSLLHLNSYLTWAEWGLGPVDIITMSPGEKSSMFFWVVCFFCFFPPTFASQIFRSFVFTFHVPSGITSALLTPLLPISHMWAG